MVDVVPEGVSRQTRRVKFKFKAYSFNAARAHEILDELIAADLIRTSFGAFPTNE